MFIPNLIWGLITGLFHISLSILAFPFQLIFGLVRILLTPFVAVYFFLSPAHVDTSSATTSSNTDVIFKNEPDTTEIRYYSSDDLDSGLDQLMVMRGFAKPLSFTNIDHDKSNPISISDRGEDIKLTKLDLKKNKTYAFVGEVEEDYRCRFLKMGILNSKGELLAESESLTDPIVTFKAKRSQGYTLATNVTSHIDGASCLSDVTEYIK